MSHKTSRIFLISEEGANYKVFDSFDNFDEAMKYYETRKRESIGKVYFNVCLFHHSFSYKLGEITGD